MDGAFFYLSAVDFCADIAGLRNCELPCLAAGSVKVMRKFDSGIWQKSITGWVLRRPLGYVWAVGAQMGKGRGLRIAASLCSSQ